MVISSAPTPVKPNIATETPISAAGMVKLIPLARSLVSQPNSVNGRARARATVMRVKPATDATAKRSMIEYLLVCSRATVLTTMMTVQAVRDDRDSGSPTMGSRMEQAAAVPPMMPPRWNILVKSMPIHR